MGILVVSTAVGPIGQGRGGRTEVAFTPLCVAWWTGDHLMTLAPEGTAVTGCPLSCRCVQRRHVRVKRYHFLEGLSCYWQGLDIDYSTKVRKIPKRFTPFSYRRQAVDAFERLFKIFQTSKIVLSYSSNGYPDLHQLTEILAKTKRDIQVFKRDHTYHFGNHCNVKRAAVEQYLIVGQ